MTGPDLPFDGGISRYFKEGAPGWVRTAIEQGEEKDVLSEAYPYDMRMKKKEYEDTLDALQIELVKFQAWVIGTGARVCVLFEGRDGAGKGGAISRIRMNLDSRLAKTVALPAPNAVEASQWHFQRYVEHLPAGSEITLFDRSWYNRGVVEKVFGFATDAERERFFNQVGDFERMLVEDGMHLRKVWLNVGRAEQLRRMLARERDPLKQWKLSRIDVDGLARWDDYSDAITETFRRSHSEAAPWWVIRADDKRRARIATIRAILAGIDYDGRDDELVRPPDPKIAGGPEIWTDG
jgi:polyphosphate kinase 2